MAEAHSDGERASSGRTIHNGLFNDGMVLYPITICDETRQGHLEGLNERNREWLLKNSYLRSSQKFHRARMPYKRRSRFWWTFSIPRPRQFFQKREFFNSHGILRQLTLIHYRQGQIRARNLKRGCARHLERKKLANAPELAEQLTR